MKVARTIVRYYCDFCGSEFHENDAPLIKFRGLQGQFRNLYLGHTGGEEENIELCPKCSGEFIEWRESKKKEQPEIKVEGK